MASPTPSPFRSPLALLLFFGVTIVGVGLDLWSKHVAFDRLLVAMVTVPDASLPDGRVEVSSREYQFIPNWLVFHVTANQGAVFGLGRGQRWLFVVVSVAAIAVLTSLFSRSENRHFYQLLLGMLLAGVLGEHVRPHPPRLCARHDLRPARLEEPASRHLPGMADGLSVDLQCRGFAAVCGSVFDDRL